MQWKQACGLGHISDALTPRAGGAVASIVACYTVVARRQKGVWVCAVDHASDDPAPSPFKQQPRGSGTPWSTISQSAAGNHRRIVYAPDEHLILAFNMGNVHLIASEEGWALVFGADETARGERTNHLNIQPTLTELPLRIIVNRDLLVRPYQPLFFHRGSAR